jgi:excisionase family DNA binding protein
MNPNIPANGPLQPLAYHLRDVCAKLNISRATLDREVARGRLRVVKIGCASRITAGELERYLSNLPARPAYGLRSEVA